MRPRTVCLFAVTAGLLVGACSVTATPPDTQAGGVAQQMLGKGHPFTIADLPEGRFRSRLESLTPAAQDRAIAWLHRFEFPLNDLESLQVDDEGGVFYADSPLPPPTE
ncbi:MAG: hypothetical protein WBM67_04565 [Sedimenticolaceae bacterium]